MAAGLLAFALLASTGLADGGLFPRTWRLATIALAALAAAALLARLRITLSRLEWGVLASLAAFAVWIAVSGAWSGAASVSILQAERTGVYVVGLLAMLLVAERASVPHLLGGLLAGITLVSAYGLVKYLFWPPPIDYFEGRLLYQPLGYANALGIFVTIGILLSLGLASWTRDQLARAMSLLPLVVLVPTLYLTSSVGAWIALATGIVWLAPAGKRLRLPLAALWIAGSVAVAVLVSSGRWGALSHLVGAPRAHYWRVAWAEYRGHPFLGSGAGTFGDFSLAGGPPESFSRTPHSLYIQVLAELGPVGLFLVVAALTLPLLRLRNPHHPLVAAAAAGYIAFLLHTGIDWDWELPAVTLAGLFCGTAILAATRPPSQPRISWRIRVALPIPALALAVVGLLRLHSGPKLPFGP